MCAFLKRHGSSSLLAAGLVLSDLVMQGWQLRVRGGRVSVRPPATVSDNHTAEKARIRRQELVKRDAQLRQPAVLKFLRSVEPLGFSTENSSRFSPYA